MNIVNRVKNILITPKTEWVVINNERNTTSTILTTYVVPLIVVGVLAAFIGNGLIGRNFYGFSTASIELGLVSALFYIISSFIQLFVLAVIIDALAPTFNSEKNWDRSFALAAYSLTAAYVGAIFLIIPALSILVIICSLYSLYILYMGIPIMKNTPEDKRVAYLAVIILVMIVAMIILGWIQAEILRSMYGIGNLRFNDFD